MGKRVLRFVLLLLLSWGVMTFTHEMGHVVCGWAAGGTLQHVELLPWQLPHSHFAPDPHPLITLWGGPILGVAVPLLVALVLRRDWIWFVASFCVIANGFYLALAWLTGDRHLDTARLLAAGAHPGMILTYCMITIGLGYLAFRRQCIRVLSPPGQDLDRRLSGAESAGTLR